MSALSSPSDYILVSRKLFAQGRFKAARRALNKAEDVAFLTLRVRDYAAYIADARADICRAERGLKPLLKRLA